MTTCGFAQMMPDCTPQGDPQRAAIRACSRRPAHWYNGTRPRLMATAMNQTNDPSPTPDTPNPLTGGFAFFGGFDIILLSLWAVFIPHIAISFRDLLTDWGADLPWLTMVAQKGYAGFSAVMALLAAANMTILILRSRPDSWAATHPHKARRILKLCFFSGLTLLVVFIVALYLPIYKMGQAVGD